MSGRSLESLFVTQEEQRSDESLELIIFFSLVGLWALMEGFSWVKKLKEKHGEKKVAEALEKSQKAVEEISKKINGVADGVLKELSPALKKAIADNDLGKFLEVTSPKKLQEEATKWFKDVIQSNVKGMIDGSDKKHGPETGIHLYLVSAKMDMDDVHRDDEDARLKTFKTMQLVFGEVVKTYFKNKFNKIVAGVDVINGDNNIDESQLKKLNPGDVRASLFEGSAWGATYHTSGVILQIDFAIDYGFLD